jgi:hypothetical protein
MLAGARVGTSKRAATKLRRTVARGGNCASGMTTARASFRGPSNVESFAIPALGLRPARALAD